MAKLPNSFRQQNRTTRSFRDQYDKLPEVIKEACRNGCLLFHGNPDHPSLARHPLHDIGKAKHQPGSFAVSVTMQYRAIYLVDDKGTNVWYWIGTHAQYNKFTGKSG